LILDHDLKKAVCPKCINDVRVDVLFEQATTWDDVETSTFGGDRYWVLQCRGCDEVFFGRGSTFSEVTEQVQNAVSGEWHTVPVENLVFYPRALRRKKPEWFDWRFEFQYTTTANLLREVYTSLDHELAVLATIGIRTVFDSVSTELGIKNDMGFDLKINELLRNHHITGRERDYLQILVLAGNAAAHTGWQAEKEQIQTLMDILEGLIHRAIILPTKVAKIQHSIPKR
jgi:hypothetical protein